MTYWRLDPPFLKMCKDRGVYGYGHFSHWSWRWWLLLHMLFTQAKRVLMRQLPGAQLPDW